MLKKLKNIVKNLLAVTWVRKIYENLTLTILGVFGSSRLLSTVYTILGFITFNREQYAVLRGRRNYYRNLKKDRLSHIELRRNIHRIEKAMTMQPRRPVFARDYIGETIEFYGETARQCNVDKGSIDQSELEWAHDVLKRYFSVVKAGDAKIDDARIRFQQTYEVYERNANTEKAPFLRKNGAKSNVTYDQLLQLAMQRRSVRWFQQKKVPRELIDKALMVARQSPTACNRLPYEYRIFDNPEMVKKVAGIPFGAGGYNHQIPTIIVVVGKQDSYFSPRDRHAIYVDASLANMAFMFALETLGLSSSSINWPDFEPLEMKMQKTLGLDPSERVVMMMAVGYADPNGGIPFSQKKSLDVLRSYNELSKK
jgi:nitroreductase